ncbi:MAG: ABC transporter ATP-binding protein, partial [Candidatus Krumholzibacteriia bacterium]
MVLRLENVHKSFTCGFLMRRREVLRGVSLSVGPGDAYALLGANGAGKSTTIRILLGLTRPDSGSGTLLGRPLGDRRVRARLGYLPEGPTFHEQLTAVEFLGYCGQLLGRRGAALTRCVEENLCRVQLQHARKMRLRKMSKGMLQRLGLAQALLGDPELLVLDEPMSGLDPPGRKLVRDLVLDQRAAGRTVLLSTHILSDAEVVCTRAGILRCGRVESELCLDDVWSFGSECVEITVSGLTADAFRRLQPLARSAVDVGGRFLFTVSPGEPVHEIVQAALAAGGRLESVAPRRASLEDAYLEAT